MENEKEIIKKKVWFTADIKQSSEAGMMCTINEDNSYLLQRTCKSEIFLHHLTLHTSFFHIININKLIQDSSGIMTTTKRQVTSQCTASPWDWMCPHSMTHEVLPQGSCKPVFPKVQTFAEKNNFKGPPKQHSSQFNRRWYHLCLPNQDSWWLAYWSSIPSRNTRQEGTISYDPLQEKSQQSTCGAWTSFWVHYPCNH